jgi:Tfp pilus assembly protein PilN
MLRTNLSTRPFYNERIIHLLIALAGVIVLGITLFNVVKVIDLSRQNTDLSRRIERDRAEGDRLKREAARIRKGIDPKELGVVAAAAHEANTLIDQRTFSWTQFFNHLEATLPPDVMLTAVRPNVDHGATRITMVVVGRTPEDIDEFIEKLESTGAFEKILARQTDKTDDGLNRAVLESVYTPDQEEAKPAAGSGESKPAEQQKPDGQPKAGDQGKEQPKSGSQTRPAAKSPTTSKSADGASSSGTGPAKVAEPKS